MGILFLCPKDVDLQCLGTKCFEHLEYTPDSSFFDIPQKMYLVMELCEGGELADALKSQERIPEEECKIIMTRLASAISYLHKNGECCTRTMWLCVNVQLSVCAVVIQQNICMYVCYMSIMLVMMTFCNQTF